MTRANALALRQSGLRPLAGTRKRSQPEIERRKRQRANNPVQPQTRNMDKRLDSMEDLTEMIRMGWGSTPGRMIPADWRTRRGPIDPVFVRRSI